MSTIFDYFEVSGEDSTHVYYDIKEGYTASWKHEDVVCIGLDKEGDDHQIHTTDRGQLAATSSAIESIEVYELMRVY